MGSISSLSSSLTSSNVEVVFALSLPFSFSRFAASLIRAIGSKLSERSLWRGESVSCASRISSSNSTSKSGTHSMIGMDSSTPVLRKLCGTFSSRVLSASSFFFSALASFFCSLSLAFSLAFFSFALALASFAKAFASLAMVLLSCFGMTVSSSSNAELETPATGSSFNTCNLLAIPSLSTTCTFSFVPSTTG